MVKQAVLMLYAMASLARLLLVVMSCELIMRLDCVVVAPVVLSALLIDSLSHRGLSKLLVKSMVLTKLLKAVLQDSSPQNQTFPLLFIYLDFFWCELLSFGDIGCRDFCLLSNIMELDCTFLVLNATIKCILKLNSNVSFQILKIIQRP